MNPNKITSARDHPKPSRSPSSPDDTPDIEVHIEDFNPEDYISAILADLNPEPPSVDDLVRESAPPARTLIPPPTPRAVEWVLEDADLISSAPPLAPVPPARADDEDRFTFPPPVTPSVSSIAPVALSDDEDDEPRPAPHPHRRRSERMLLTAFAAVAVAVVAVAGYDISKSTLLGATWQGGTSYKRVAAAVNKLAPTAEPTHELQPVVISADRSRAALIGKGRLAPEPDSTDIPFDPSATSMALDVATAEATTRCMRGGQDPVSINVRVTFGPSGRASSVQVEASPDTPAPTRLCTEQVFSRVKIPRYTGEEMTFTRWLHIK